MLQQKEAAEMVADCDFRSSDHVALWMRPEGRPFHFSAIEFWACLVTFLAGMGLFHTLKLLHSSLKSDRPNRKKFCLRNILVQISYFAAQLNTEMFWIILEQYLDKEEKKDP